jgi:hypothetical protein
MAFKPQATLGDAPISQEAPAASETIVAPTVDVGAPPKFKPTGSIKDSGGNYGFKKMGEGEGDYVSTYSGGRKSGSQIAGETLKATGIGGAIGAFTPEILTGLGIAAAPFPLTAPLAPALLTAGQAARGARLGTAATSALLAGGSKLAGELTPGKETPVAIPGTGRTMPRGELVENVVGFGAPAAGAVAKSVVLRAPLMHNVVAYFRQKSGSQGEYADAAARELANFRNRTPVNELLQSNRASQRLEASNTDSYREVFKFLQSKDQATQDAAIGRISAAQQQADKILADATQRANQLVTTDKARAKLVLDEGDAAARRIIDQSVDDVAKKLGIARRAESAARKVTAAPGQTLQSIGNFNVTNAEIGGSLQQRVVANLSSEEQALSSQYTQARKAVDDIVRQKESQGIGVKNTQAFAELRDFIDSKLLRGRFGKEAQFAPVTEAQQKNVYENIRKAINDQEILIGVSQDGTPVYRKVPTSFEALDHVRRKLGEVFDGKAVEGYDGLLKDQARDLYGKIRKIQTEYTDNAYDSVLKNYAEGKGAVNELGIPTGAKLTKTDRLNPEYLTYDPSGLPNEFFSSRKKVQDLITLVRDPAYVEQQASNHVARVLKDKDAKFAEKYLFDNKEWISLFPNLERNVAAHTAALKRGESVAPKSTTLAQSLRTEVKALPGVAQKEAAATQKEAAKSAKQIEEESRKQAKQIMGEAQAQAKVLSASAKQAQKLLGTGDPVAEIEKLILTGQTKRLEEIAPLLKEDANAMRAFDQSLKITLSRENPATIVDKWERTIKPALSNTGLISPAQADNITKRINQVRMTLEPNEAALTMVSIIRGGTTSSVARSLSGE